MNQSLLKKLIAMIGSLGLCMTAGSIWAEGTPEAGATPEAEGASLTMLAVQPSYLQVSRTWNIGGDKVSISVSGIGGALTTYVGGGFGWLVGAGAILPNHFSYSTTISNKESSGSLDLDDQSIFALLFADVGAGWLVSFPASPIQVLIGPTWHINVLSLEDILENKSIGFEPPASSWTTGIGLQVTPSYTVSDVIGIGFTVRASYDLLQGYTGGSWDNWEYAPGFSWGASLAISFVL